MITYGNQNGRINVFFSKINAEKKGFFNPRLKFGFFACMIFFALLVIFNARFDNILSNSERNVLKSLFGKKRKKCVVDRHSLSMSNDLFEKVDSQKRKKRKLHLMFFVDYGNQQNKNIIKFRKNIFKKLIVFL